MACSGSLPWAGPRPTARRAPLTLRLGTCLSSGVLSSFWDVPVHFAIIGPFWHERAAPPTAAVFLDWCIWAIPWTYLLERRQGGTATRKTVRKKRAKPKGRRESTLSDAPRLGVWRGVSGGAPLHQGPPANPSCNGGNTSAAKQSDQLAWIRGKWGLR